MSISAGQQLLEALRKIDRPGSFCTRGRLPAVLPGLEVAGIGAIALPLKRRPAATLKKHARQAPYGKGEQTLVDTNVRRVWELDADEVTLANPEWPQAVEQAVREVQSQFGLEQQKLASHLYKLLFYEPGSFFVSHRDGEKLDRMVATLVVVLPSEHEGGQLVVRHDGREETIDFGGEPSRFHTQYAAFYADCEHEIRPVTKGYRLALVYNLTLARSKQRITAPTSGAEIDAAGRILGRWKDTRSPAKLAVLLDHQYTKTGLTCDALKGVDRAKASVLFEAARRSGCDAHLALVTLWQSGEAEPTDGYRGYDRYGYTSYGDADDHEMGEIYDWSLTAEQFSDADGNHVAFGQIPLKDDEVVAEQPIHEGEPDEQDFEGYTGNAGMTLDRWYHRAAVVLWPAEERFDVLCEAGVESAVVGLAQMMSQWRGAKKGEQAALEQQCLQFAERIISNWPSCEFRDRYAVEGAADQPEEMLPLLEELGDLSLIARWIGGVLASDVTVDPGKSLGDVCKRLGWTTFQDELRAVFQKTTNETIARNARLLADCCLRRGRSVERRELCAALAQEMLSALVAWDSRKREYDWRACKVDRSELVPLLIKSFLAIDEPELLGNLVDHMAGLPKAYDLTTVQMPALVKLKPWLRRNVKRPCSPLHQWLTALRDELASRVAHPPRQPTDWRRAAAIRCTCADCKQLSDFLKRPNEETLRLALSKERRRHLHQIIDENRLDVTHVTERLGRPYTLVCTKTNGSYERSRKAHQLDVDHFGAIQEVLEWHEALEVPQTTRKPRTKR